MEELELRTSPTKVMPTLHEQKKYWDQRWEKEKTPCTWQIRQGDAIISLINKIPGGNLNLLDLGCGTGWMTNLVKAFGKVRGMDLSENAIDIAKLMYPEIDFVAENIFDSQIPQETFDVVIAQEVIAHVDNQPLLLNIIADILKPNGYLILTTVNKIVLDRLELGTEPTGHIKQWLTMSDIKRLCGKRFIVLEYLTVNPLGTRGFLRFVNSYKINKLLNYFISGKKVEWIKERLGLGYTRVVFLQKK